MMMMEEHRRVVMMMEEHRRVVMMIEEHRRVMMTMVMLEAVMDVKGVTDVE
jgi:hypothetical protein